LNLNEIFQVFSNKRCRTFFLLCIELLLFIYILSTRLIVTDTLWTISDRYPYKLILGIETKQKFLSESIPVYDALQFLNKQPEKDLKVFSLGNESRTYTRARIYGPIFSTEARRILLTSKNEIDLAKKLSEYGYSYILVFPGGQRRDPEFYTSPYLSEAFYRNFTQLIFAANTVKVYRFYANSAPKPYISINLLRNPGFENINNGIPINWTIIGRPTVDTDGEKSHSGNTAIRVKGPSSSVLYQDVAVQPNKLYTVNYWCRSDYNGQVIQVFIEWLDFEKQSIRREADWIPINSEWSIYDLSSTSPNNAAYARIYLSISTNGEAWFDDICFVQGQYCQ